MSDEWRCGWCWELIDIEAGPDAHVCKSPVSPEARKALEAFDAYAGIKRVCKRCGKVLRREPTIHTCEAKKSEAT